LDVAGIETVHSYLRSAAEQGVGVLLISEDLDEILALADRVVVMYEGAVVGERAAESATVEEFGLLMAGGEGEPWCASSDVSTRHAGCRWRFPSPRSGPRSFSRH